MLGEKETRLLKAVSQQEPLEASEEQEATGKRGIMDVVKGFLPKRKEKPAVSQEQPPARPAAKKVTPILKKKK
jgi:hypothetical protein